MWCISFESLSSLFVLYCSIMILQIFFIKVCLFFIFFILAICYVNNLSNLLPILFYITFLRHILMISRFFLFSSKLVYCSGKYIFGLIIIIFIYWVHILFVIVVIYSYSNFCFLQWKVVIYSWLYIHMSRFRLVVMVVIYKSWIIKFYLFLFFSYLW